ncbi:MAG TPA: hypothetical protein VF222_08995 [Nitrososphaeraceae archaeon]
MNHVLKKRNRFRGKTENEKLYNDNMVLASELKEDIQIIINSHEKQFVNKKADKDESD